MDGRPEGDSSTRGDGVRTEPINVAPSDDLGGNPRLQQIEGDIVQARSAMSQTVGTIEQRLNPRRLVKEAKARITGATRDKLQTLVDSASDAAQTWADRTRRTATTVGGHMRKYPVPAALAGLAMGLLAYTMRLSSGSASPAGAEAREPETGEWESPGSERRTTRSRMVSGSLPVLIAGAGAWLLVRRPWADGRAATVDARNTN